MSDSVALARVLGDMERRLRVLERSSQLARSSVVVDGSPVTVVGGIRTGMEAAVAADTAQSAADAAQTAADTAQTAANTAQTAANTALTTANGKNKVTFSPDPPAAAGVAAGDVWFRYDQQFQIYGQWEWTGSAWRQRTIRSEVIAYLTAAKITTGELAAGVRIIAGPAAGAHTEVAADGLRVFDTTPDGTLQESSRLGTGQGDVFSTINPLTGRSAATIDSTGIASFSGLRLFDDLQIAGRPLLGDFQGYTVPNEARAIGWVDRLPRGVVGYALRNVAGVTFTSGERAFVVLRVYFEPGRAYRVHVPNMLLSGDTASTVVGLNLRYAASNVALSSKILGFSRAAGTTLSAHTVHTLLRCNPGGTAVGGEVEPGYGELLLSMVGSNGTATVNASETARDARIFVEDNGVDLPETGANSDLGATINGSPGVTAPVVVTSVVDRKPSWSASYRGDGTRRDDTTDLIQGDSPNESFNGNQKALIGLGNQATDLLAGATVKRVEVYLWYGHWYYESGGVCNVGYHGWTGTTSTSAPATFGTTTLDAMGWIPSTGRWKRGEGRWFTLPSAWYAGFKDGSIRGITLGVNSTDPLHYGRATGGGDPTFRFTYVK